MTSRFRCISLIFATFVLATVSFAATSATTSKNKKKEGRIAESARAQRHMARLRHRRAVAHRARRARSTASLSTTKSARSARLRRRRSHYVEHFYTSSYATATADGDDVRGEDAVVRQAAIDALGNMNGTVVAIDPASGRILAMVNQKLGLSEGAQPCSTVKVAVALAGLKESLITKDMELKLGRRSHMNLTDALAHSNNAYFEALGRKLGFARVSRYAHMFGMGELAGYDIEGEHLGQFPTVAPGMRDGGVGKLCSYGESISMTPLQLGAMMVAVANGGTLYYLQHPQSADEVAGFVPRVKRQLDIA